MFFRTMLVSIFSVLFQTLRSFGRLTVTPSTDRQLTGNGAHAQSADHAVPQMPTAATEPSDHELPLELQIWEGEGGRVLD